MERLAGFRYRQIIKRLKSFGFQFDRHAAGSHESRSYNGIIEIPKTPKDWYDRTLKVILVKETEPEIKDKDTDKTELVRFFNRFNADLTGWKFNRDEANERYQAHHDYQRFKHAASSDNIYFSFY